MDLRVLAFGIGSLGCSCVSGRGTRSSGVVGVLFVEAVDHGAGHVRIHLDDHGWLPGWVHEGGDHAGLVHAAVAEPLFDRLLQVAGEPERSLVLVAEVAHGDLPRSDRRG